MVMSVEGSWGVRPGPVNDDLRSKLAWDDEKQWKLIEREKRTFLWIKILSLPAPMFVVVKMSKLSKKWPRKYLLNVTVHGFSKALKLGECTFVTIFFKILLNFVKNYPLLTLHGGLLWWDQISVSGSNICEWIRIFLSHFCVYRHANLCSGLSPQLIKKEIAFLGILPRKWHQLRFEPAALTDHEHLNWVWRSTNYAMSQLMKTLLLWKNIKLVLCIKRSYKGQNGPLKGYKIH